MNLYPEVDELGTGKEREVMALVPTPGLLIFAAIGTGPHRGSWTTMSGDGFVVSGNTLYKVASDKTYASIGTLRTTVGQVSMADNGFLANGSPNQLVIVDGLNGYWVDLSTYAFSQITDPAFFGSSLVSFQDGRFIFINPSVPQFYISDINDVTFDASNFFQTTNTAGKLVGHISVHRDLWMFGELGTQIFYNSGDIFPFAMIEGTFMEYGCAAKFSISKISNTVFWLGRNKEGQGMVFMANGYAPQRISTHAVEFAIKSYGDVSGATGFSYQDNGHSFYVLNFPTANTTWVFDSRTMMWHERTYLNNGQEERHRASCHMFAFNKHLVGDYQNGNLYELTDSVYSDNGAPISKRRTSPHISDDMKWTFYNSFQLDAEVGVGLDGTQQGTDPQVMLRFSDDGGHSWSDEIWSSLGQIGHTRHRARWTRLGRSRDRVWDLKITDPVKTVLIGAELDVMQGAD